MSTEWHLVLGRDGTVLGATGGAPASWIGSPLEDRDDVPEELREAGRTVLDSAHASAAPVAASVFLESVQHAVHLTVIDALPLRRVPTNLRDLLHSTLSVMQQQARAFDVTMNLAVDDHVPAVVSLDAEKIAWVTTVLVGNALRYVHHGSMMRPGGAISVRVMYISAGPKITIEVEDDGPGIPADRLGSLFSAGPDRPGIGLGLSMVREVVSAHGGHLDVRSATDTFRSGTTIRITLPVW